MSSSLWIQHVPAGKFITVTPTTRLLVVNACLGYTVFEGRGSAALKFSRSGIKKAPCIASFSKDTREHVRLEVVLEAAVTYAFAAVGSYSIDLLGYFSPTADAAADTHRPPPSVNLATRSRPNTDSTTLVVQASPNASAKRKTSDDSDQSDIEVSRRKKLKSSTTTSNIALLQPTVQCDVYHRAPSYDSRKPGTPSRHRGN